MGGPKWLIILHSKWFVSDSKYSYFRKTLRYPVSFIEHSWESSSIVVCCFCSSLCVVSGYGMAFLFRIYSDSNVRIFNQQKNIWLSFHVILRWQFTNLTCHKPVRPKLNLKTNRVHCRTTYNVINGILLDLAEHILSLFLFIFLLVYDFENNIIQIFFSL